MKKYPKWSWDKNQLSKICCPICSSQDYQIIYTRVDGLDIVSCEACSFRFVQPQPSQSELNRFYQQGYFSGNHDFHQGENYFAARKRDIETEKVTGWNFIKNHVDVSQKRVLELGCADGALLVLAQQYGANKVVGVEVSTEAVSYGRQQYNLEIIETSVDILPFANSTFDIVTAFDLIEHVRHPAQLFKEINRVLEIEGVFVGACPDMGCFDDWGAEWIGVNSNMEHISYFDDITLSSIAKQFGFQVNLIKYDGFPLELQQYKILGKKQPLSTIQKLIQPNVLFHNIWQKNRVKIKKSHHKHELLFVFSKVTK